MPSCVQFSNTWAPAFRNRCKAPIQTPEPQRRKMRARILSALLVIVGVHSTAMAYEADVHFGLTYWLASKAGYADWQSKAIAVGDLRVDSGSASTLEVLLEYACAGDFPKVAREIQSRHYPSQRAVPAAPEDRVVERGSTAARARLLETIARAAGKEAQFLGLFGAGLHTLQDSWSHAGVPSVPAPGGGLKCNPQLVSGPPLRPGFGPHGANLTFVSSIDAIAMARATYQALLDFPALQGPPRKAEQWGSLINAVEKFAVARTKTDKRKWFLDQGIGTTDFLEGISLPDGPDPGPLNSDARSLPALISPISSQFDAPVDARKFFDGLIVRWFGDEPIENVVSDLAGRKTADLGRKRSIASTGDPHLRNLVAKMKIWKFRDHGAVAQLAHAEHPLSTKQIAEVDSIAKRTSPYVVSRAEEGLLPLVAKGESVSPLLPYILRMLPREEYPRPRAIAIARLKHAPYDTVGWIAERSDAGWELVDVVAVVDQ